MAGKSGLTAMTRTGPSAPVRWLEAQGAIKAGTSAPKVLDYGCGKGADVDYLGCDGYDPHHRPREFKQPVQYDVILCTYVANVLDCWERENLHRHLRCLLAAGGTAYVTVRRDIPEGTRGLTATGTYQEWVDLSAEWPTTKLLVDIPGAFAIYQFTPYAGAV